jgi:PAS domain S-box-containing protein
VDGSFDKPLNLQGESKDFIKSIIDGIGDPIMIIDPWDYRIHTVNQAMINLTNEPNCLSKCCYELSHVRESPCDEPDEPCPLKQVIKTGNTVRVLHIHTLADNETIYADIVATPVFENGNVVQVIQSIHDITEIKLTEKALRETRDYLNKLINYANAPIIVWDPEIKIIRTNSAFEHLVGYSSSEIIGQDLSVIFPEESRIESLRKLTQFSGEYWESVEIPIFRKDGDIRFTIWSMANVYEEDGTTIISTIAQGTDITERKWAEENLQRTAKELQHSNELKDLFIDILYHDLLNPAGIVKGYTDVLLAKESDTGDVQTLEIIKKNNDKIIETVETASKFAKLKTIEELNCLKIDIGPVVQEVVENFRPGIEEKQIIVQYNIKGPCSAWANPIIEDLFSNLLSNAIKYSPKRGRITLDILDEGRFWKFVIIDVGPGIHDKDKSNIFDRFKHIDKHGIKGTGLGLAIVKRIADLHMGNVGVEDNPEGKGSLFWATIKKA